MRRALERELATAAAPTPPPTIPDHDLIQRIGRGAYGEVWLARNALGTLRAVKIVHRHDFDEAHPYEREFNGILKYEPLSRSHEGLIQVLQVGRNDVTGYFYYVMELADPLRPTLSGETANPSYHPHTLRTELKGSVPLTAEHVAQLTLRLASALAHLHSHGLIHRDVKPGNVIFVNGQPKLADIGSVTGVADAKSFVGTEGFIPPEGPGTVQADLYSLGKLLYELATGFDRLDFPRLPVSVTTGTEHQALLELNEIVTKACAPAPRERYQSAHEVVADLNLFLAGHSLREDRRIVRRLARFKHLAVAGGLAVVLAVPIVWGSKVAQKKAERRAQAEADLRHRAEAAEQSGREQLFGALLEQARAVVRSGEIGHRTKALAALRQAAAITNAVELRREVFAALALPDLRWERDLTLPSDTTMVGLDPELKRLAICQGSGPVEILSTSNSSTLAILPARTSAAARSCKWNQDGRFLTVVRHQREQGLRDLEVWNVAENRCVLSLTSGKSDAFAFAPHGARLIAATEENHATIYDLVSGHTEPPLTFPGIPRQLAFAPDGQRLAVVHELRAGLQLSIHNLKTGNMQTCLQFQHELGDIAWDAQGRWIAIADHGGAIHRYDPLTGTMQKLGRHKAQAACTTFHPNSDYLMTGGWDRELIVWDIKSLRRVFTAPLDGFYSQFSSDGRSCAVFKMASHQLSFFDFELPVTHRELPEDLGSLVRHAAFSPDGRWLAASGHDRMAVWDLNRPDTAAIVDEMPSGRPVFTPDSREIFACDDRRCLRWRLSASAEGPPKLEPLGLFETEGFPSICAASNTMAISTIRGTHLFTTSSMPDGSVAWSTTTNGLNSISPDGKWLGIYAPFGKALHVYRLPGLEPEVIIAHPASIGGFAFSPGGNELAIASREGMAFWRPGKWERTRSLKFFNQIICQPDGRGLWLSRDLREAGLYEPVSLQPLLPLPTGMIPLAVSPDSQRVVVSVDSQRLQIWDISIVRSQLRELGIDWSSD